MTSKAFSNTATSQGETQRRIIGNSIAALKATARTSTNELERRNAKLMLERLGETID